MLRIFNIIAAAAYAAAGIYNLVGRMISDHGEGYSLSLFLVDLTIAGCFIAALGLLLLMYGKRFGLSLMFVCTIGLLFLIPFTGQAWLAPVYLILALVGWLVYRNIGKPVKK